MIIVTVAECKDKWKNIRNGYVRSLKPSYKGVQKKPYYLCDELQFLLPYINPATNIQIDMIRMPSPMEETKPDIEELQKEEDNEIVVSPDINHERQFTKRKTKFVKKKMATRDVDRAFMAWLLTKKTRMDDARKMFLFSLLPDVKKLSEEQLSVFRIKVLLLLEELKIQSSSGLQDPLEQMK